MRGATLQNLCIAGLMLILVLADAPAQAQPSDPSQSPPESPQPPVEAPVEPRPPELLESTEATYPEQPKAARIEAFVVLRLSIDAAGQVTEAEVMQPAGHGFDEAAREAVLRFRFKPAEQQGQPIAARILFRYDFKLPAEAPPAEAPPAEAPPVQAAAPPAPVAFPAPPAQPVDVMVQGERTRAQELQQSAEAVNVIDTRKAKEQTADLGEVLARTQGVAVRRDGGLGSSTNFSLNGLYDDQIRFFLDGVPLDLAGYPFGIANVPVNLVDRVEVHRGVVPIRLGADALGGSVNLIRDQSYETHAGASYQVGSFGTHRVTAEGGYRHEPTGFVVGGAGFFDLTDNDYRVDVEIPNARGRLSPATVPRFHDDYRAYGGTVEVGLVDRPWARRLSLQGFYSSYDKELQHNVLMTLPYGEVTYGETVYGATGRYEVALDPQVDLELVGNYSHRIIDYVDKGRWVYDWNGERILERRVPGEVEPVAHDQTVWQDSAFGRGLVQWTLAPEHILRASFTPTFATRTGDERIQVEPDARDPLTAEREVFTFVSGFEYELKVFGDRLSNMIFVKDYFYLAHSEETLPGNVFIARDNEHHSFGVGDSLRFRFTPFLYAKASYEYATRLPRPDEVFGDAVRTHANLELEPEVSHNANIGPRLELSGTMLGAFTLDINAFLRESDQLIVLLGSELYFTYQNVYKARGIGLENAFYWVSPGRYVSIDGMLTWQDMRNASSQGAFGEHEGDRIPNRPHLFASWGVRLRFAGMPGSRDTIEPFYGGRYVQSFFRGWESQGIRELKDTIDAQTTHNVGISWIVSGELARVTATFEVDNLTDAKVFDNFGVQRPGRAFYAKVTGQM